MKAEYGGPITIYKLNSAGTDRRTGTKTVDRDSVYVDRAVVLPDMLTRTAVQTISLISANKQVVQGGTYDPGTRRFIIDRRDVPNWELQQDDWIVYTGFRYDIKSIEDFEQDTAWLVTAKKVDGAKVNEDVRSTAAQNLIFSDSAEATVS
jgi:hypothetical protein